MRILGDHVLGMGKEILLTLSVGKAGFPSDSRAGFDLIRMHEFQACEIPLLWCSGSALWSAAAPEPRDAPVHVNVPHYRLAPLLRASGYMQLLDFDPRYFSALGYG